eukprot:EG_transcript_32390
MAADVRAKLSRRPATTTRNRLEGRGQRDDDSSEEQALEGDVRHPPARPVGSAAAVASSIREKLSRRTAPPAGLAPPPGRSGERRGPAPRRPASPSSSPSSSDAENQSRSPARRGRASRSPPRRPRGG